MAALALLCACRAAPAQDEPRRYYADEIVAIVEGEPITLSELELACRLHPEYHDIADGSREQREFRRRVLLDGAQPESGELGLITQKVLLQKAKELEIELSETDQARLDQDIARVAERHRGGIDGLRAALQQIQVTYDYFVARKRANLLITKLLMSSVSREIFVTPTEIRHQYEKNVKDYERAGEIRLRQLVLYLDDDEAPHAPPPAIRELVKAKAWDARAFAASLRARIAAGELPFEEAQRQFSMGRPADREERVFAPEGLRASDLFPPIPQRVEAMAVGELSEIIETSGSMRPGPVAALHLVLLVDRQDRGVVPLEEVQQEIELDLKEEVWSQRREAWIAQTRAAAHVQVFLRASD